MKKILVYVSSIFYSPIMLIKVFSALVIILDEWSGDIIKNFIKDNTEDE